MQPAKFFSATILASTLLGACSIYHPQIQQGNIITPKMIASIKPGMNKSSVKYLLGSPDIQNPWNADKWYYVYTNKQQGLPAVTNKLILTFNEEGKLTHVSGNYPSPAPLRYKTYHAN